MKLEKEMKQLSPPMAGRGPGRPCQCYINGASTEILFTRGGQTLGDELSILFP